MGENVERSSSIMTFFRLLKHQQWNEIIFLLLLSSLFILLSSQSPHFLHDIFCFTSNLLRCDWGSTNSQILSKKSYKQIVESTSLKCEILSEFHRLNQVYFVKSNRAHENVYFPCRVQIEFRCLLTIFSILIFRADKMPNRQHQMMCIHFSSMVFLIAFS